MKMAGRFSRLGMVGAHCNCCALAALAAAAARPDAGSYRRTCAAAGERLQVRCDTCAWDDWGCKRRLPGRFFCALGAAAERNPALAVVARRGAFCAAALRDLSGAK